MYDEMTVFEAEELQRQFDDGNWDFWEFVEDDNNNRDDDDSWMD